MTIYVVYLFDGVVFEYVETQIPLNMETKDIDRTHIIALQEVDGMLRNVELPISRPEQFIGQLEAMVYNSERTVWDMQSHLATRFPKPDNTFLDYIHPASYNASYVGGIRYPKITGYDELQKSWSEAAQQARTSYFASCKESGATPVAMEADEAEAKAIERVKKWEKQNFLRDAMRWIDASCYYDAANRLKQDNTVKMFSKENVGWSKFIHKVTDDIKVELKTNFGFGSAAYFILGLQYKGINILPYSHIVKYYAAGMADIVRCLRSYHPCRDSWTASFDFLSDFVNKSIADPEGFVKSYIMREVTEMMQGLEKIARDPRGYMEAIGDVKADPLVVNVRPMLGREKDRMQVYPEETAILFKTEKIIGALDFLQSLNEIAKEVSLVQPHIDRLLELNMSLYPEITEAIAKTRDKVTEQTAIKDRLDAQISAIAERLSPYVADIENLMKAANTDNPFSMEVYEAAHPEYKKMKEESNILNAQYWKVSGLVSDLNSFISTLNRSLSRLDEVKQSVIAA